MADLAQIRSDLQVIFRKELHNPELELRFEMRAGSLDGWDSDANTEIVRACEARWNVRFSASEIDEMRTVGDLAYAIRGKLEAKTLDAGSSPA